MTCYFRHLKAIFEKAGIQVTSENKQDIDRIIHEIVAVKYKDCSDTWQKVKRRLAENEEEFTSRLKEEWEKHEKKPQKHKKNENRGSATSSL